MASFHALLLGSLTLHWLDGGAFRLDGGSLFGPVPRPRWSELYPPADDNTVPLQAHVLLVQDGATYGLVDSGFGHHLSERQRRFYALERASHLEQGLAELGISPARLDWVVLSHLHLDHAGGMMAPSGPVFPNAGVYVQHAEVAEAHDETNRAHGVYTGDAVDRLAAAGLLKPVQGEAEVTPSVSVALTGGHSRGHQATLIRAPASDTPMRGSDTPMRGSDTPMRSSAGEALLYLGDLLVTQHHLPPAWVSALDDFPLDTIRAKREWLARASAGGWWVAFSHDVTARAGRLGADGKLSALHQ